MDDHVPVMQLRCTQIKASLPPQITPALSVFGTLLQINVLQSSVQRMGGSRLSDLLRLQATLATWLLAPTRCDDILLCAAALVLLF